MIYDLRRLDTTPGAGDPVSPKPGAQGSQEAFARSLRNRINRERWFPDFMESVARHAWSGNHTVTLAGPWAPALYRVLKEDLGAPAWGLDIEEDSDGPAPAGSQEGAA
ncbi:MAG: hypothetical protein ACLFQ3_09725 [Thiohalorhabdus sp.]